MPEIEKVGRTLKTPLAYVDELPVGTDPTIVWGLYEATAIRVNRWINVGFGGLVGAIDEKETQLTAYEKKIIKWDANCKAIIAAGEAE